MAEISDHDIEQKYVGSIVMFAKKPVFIKGLYQRGKVKILDLLSQREDIVDFTVEEFKAPATRLGMVNIAGGVLYAYRIPVRRYKLGFSRDNLKVDSLNVKYEGGGMEAVEKIKSLTSIEFADCIMGKYPNLKQAMKLLEKQGEGAVAFDRQFAVDCRNRIWYKRAVVGGVGDKGIVFSAGFQHLELLLDKNYAKETLRTSW